MHSLANLITQWTHHKPVYLLANQIPVYRLCQPIRNPCTQYASQLDTGVTSMPADQISMYLPANQIPVSNTGVPRTPANQVPVCPVCQPIRCRCAQYANQSDTGVPVCQPIRYRCTQYTSQSDTPAQLGTRTFEKIEFVSWVQGCLVSPVVKA